MPRLRSSIAAHMPEKPPPMTRTLRTGIFMKLRPAPLRDSIRMIAFNVVVGKLYREAIHFQNGFVESHGWIPWMGGEDGFDPLSCNKDRLHFQRHCEL